MTQVARAEPDGYTILVASSSFVVNPSLYANNPYDPFTDFAPVTLAGAAPTSRAGTGTWSSWVTAWTPGS